MWNLSQFGTVKFFINCLSFYPKLKIINSTGTSGYSLNFAVIILMKRNVAGHPLGLKETQLEKFWETSHLSKTLG